MTLTAGSYYIEKHGKEAGARRMAELGYGHLDLDLSDTLGEYYTARDEDFIVKLLALKQTLSREGVKVACARGPAPTETHSAEERAITFEKTVKAMVAVRHLGGSLLTVSPIYFSELEGKEALSAAREYYTALAEVAKGLSVTLSLENGWRDSPLSAFSSLIPLAKEIGSPSLKLSLSVGAANAHGENILAAIDEAGELLSQVRVEDSTEGGSLPLPLFDGTVSWADLAEALFNVGFSGILSVTAPVCSDGEDLTAEEIADRERRCAEYARLIAG